MTNYCVACGAEIPEGTQICYKCVKKYLGTDEWRAGYEAAKTEDREEINELKGRIIHLEQSYNMLALEAKPFLENQQYYEIGKDIYNIIKKVINE